MSAQFPCWKFVFLLALLCRMPPSMVMDALAAKLMEVKSWSPMESSSEIVLGVVLKIYFYWYNLTKFFWSELNFFARTRPAGCRWRERSPSWHVPSQWDSLVDLLQHFKFIPFLMFSFHTAFAQLNFLFFRPRLTTFIEIHSLNLVFFLIFP